MVGPIVCQILVTILHIFFKFYIIRVNCASRPSAARRANSKSSSSIY